LGYGSGAKAKRTEWIVKVNDIRHTAMHAARGASVTFDQLNLLDDYRRWLRAQISGDSEGGPDVLQAELDDASTADLDAAG